jgi:osmotically inducible protein OsmC
MATRSATAQWQGNLEQGNGKMALGTGAFEGPYTFKSRFEEGSGTNPEELIAAAEAGCFSMALSLGLTEAGTPPESIDTEAEVQLRRGDAGPYISGIRLKTRGRVPGIDDAAFRQAAQAAKEGCIVSKALAGVEDIQVEATLES